MVGWNEPNAVDMRTEELLAEIRRLRAEVARLEAALARSQNPGRGTARRDDAGVPTMPFGKFKDLPIVDVPPNYCRWLLDRMREEVTKTGDYSHPDAPYLIARLLKNVIPPDLNLHRAVEDLVAAYGASHPGFATERFRVWVRRSRGRLLRCWWLGVRVFKRVGCRYGVA
jgi:hypothetical protein